jgi:hypothetical protein
MVAKAAATSTISKNSNLTIGEVVMGGEMQNANDVKSKESSRIEEEKGQPDQDIELK